MKRGLLGFPLLILLTQVVSAQFYSGYGRFSFAEFFDRIDPQTIILVLLFLVFFVLIFYALSRVFKDPYGQPNKGIAGTIAFAISAMIIYGLYRTGFDIGGIFFNLGLSVDFLYPILGIVFLIITVLLIWKLRFSGFLMAFGLFILLLTIFTEIFYEKGIPLIIGIVLLVVGFLFRRGGRRVIGGVGRGALRAGRGVGKGVAWGGKTAWKGAKGVGRGAKWVGSKYDWEKEKRDLRTDVRELGAAGRGIGKGVGKGIAKGMHAIEAKKLRRAEEAAYKEDARRQKEIRKQQAVQERRQQAQEQIQQINNEIARLQQMIPNASVIERGKIEGQIRAFEKRARKLR